MRWMTDYFWHVVNGCALALLIAFAIRMIWEMWQ